jgi:hypothetical protein
MSKLEKALKKIHFNTDNGLVFCYGLDKAEHISEIYHIEDKAKKLQADAVLFRRKYKNGEIIDSKPVVYIFEEKNDIIINNEKHKKLHAKIWSSGEIDVYFIVSKTEIHIFNARKPAEVKEKKELDLKNLILVSKALKEFDDQRFSAIVFGKGTFWEQDDFKNELKEENTPFHKLLEYLIAVRKHLYGSPKGLSIETVDKLLIISILVKFLEEKKDSDGKHTLRDIYKKYKVKIFAEALEKKICISILDELASEFNGNIFNQFSLKEKLQIKEADLKPVADFLTARLAPQKTQLFLWKQYNFNHLPIELISSIYENFLPKEKGVVYTPPFLVNFLIDESMPLDIDSAKKCFSNNRFKVLDPACGSGVFLVAAYKRLLQWWSVNHYKKTDKIKFPDKKICQKILEDNIFGVDINETATFITIFSLTIAFLDKLEPKELWNDLKLKDLKDNDNIQTENFFVWAAEDENKDEKFNLVIGNPPFNPKSGIKKKDAVTEEQIRQFGIINKDIPDNNFALKFFEGAMFFGKKTCMILPSNVFFYNKTKTAQKYRNRVFTKFTVKKIFDFTHLREVLFVKKILKPVDNKKNSKKKSGRTPVCAVLSIPVESERQNIEHTVIKRTVSIEKKIFFEIDHYDRHFVPHDWAIDEKKQFIWKTNLLGGGRLFHLIYRLSLLPTLKKFINSKKKDSWKEIRGFEGGRTLAAESQDRIIGITESGEPEIKKNINIYSDNLKSKFMYEPPFMIIKQILGNNSLAACFIPKKNNFTQKKYLYYNRSFIGISLPEKDENKLKDIFDFLNLKKTNNRLNYQLYVLSISSSSLVLTETFFNKTEILSIPYPYENEDYLNLSETEKILQEDVLEYYIHLGKAISERGQGIKLHEKVKKKQLENFGQVFCDALNPIYAKNGKSWQSGKVYQTESFMVYRFGYGKNNVLSFQMVNEADEVNNILKSLIYDNTSNQSAIFTRVCRYYKHLNGFDCVFLIKPNAMRYWLNSIALRDADETFTDLKNNGF